MTRPFRFGVVAPLLSDVPTWRDRVRRIADSGCNLVDARLATVGRDVSMTALATGSWDAVAKLEAMLGRLDREEGLKLNWYRTGAKQIQSLRIDPEVVAKDDVEMLQDLIVAAVNDAQRKADDEMSQRMGGLMGGMGGMLGGLGLK